MELETEVIKNLQTAKFKLFEFFMIVYKLKKNLGYIPTKEELQKLRDLEKSLNLTHECITYFVSCMERRAGGQHEYEYMEELRKSFARDL